MEKMHESESKNKMKERIKSEHKEALQDEYKELAIAEGEKEQRAPIFIETFFPHGEKIKIIEGPNRRLKIEKIDENTLKISERNVTGEVRIEYVLPIKEVHQEVHPEPGNMGSVHVRDTWAYPNSGARFDFDLYKKELPKLLDDTEFNCFGVGMPENIKRDAFVESGFRGYWKTGRYFRSTEEATARAMELAIQAKELDLPVLDSMLGKITPRELILLKSIDSGAVPYGEEKDGGPDVNDWLSSAWFRDVENLRHFAEAEDNYGSDFLPKDSVHLDNMKTRIAVAKLIWNRMKS